MIPFPSISATPTNPSSCYSVINLRGTLDTVAKMMILNSVDRSNSARAVNFTCYWTQFFQSSVVYRGEFWVGHDRFLLHNKLLTTHYSSSR